MLEELTAAGSLPEVVEGLLDLQQHRSANHTNSGQVFLVTHVFLFIFSILMGS